MDFFVTEQAIVGSPLCTRLGLSVVFGKVIDFNICSDLDITERGF